MSLAEPRKFDALDLPTLGDVIVVDGIDHPVRSSSTLHFHGDDDVLMFELVVRAAAEPRGGSSVDDRR